MKKITALLLVLILTLSLFTGCAKKDAAASDLQYVKDKGELVIGVTVYEPMNYFDENGEWTGFDTELAIAVCEKLGVNAKFVEINWDTKEVELDAKSIDCIWNGFTINPDKEELLDYSMAYMKNAQVVITKAGIDSIDAIDGSISAEMGSAGETAIQDDAALSALDYIGVSLQSSALTEVASGASAACVIDFVMADSMIGEGTAYEDLQVIAELNAEEYGIGFRTGSDLTDEVNSILKALYADGVVMDIAEKYEVAGNIIAANFEG